MIINDINKVNLGIEVLRMFLCFWVISFHYSGNINRNKYKIITQYYHVPTFMLISFYLTYKIFAKKNVMKIKQRLERLIIPYTIIPAIYLVIILLSNSEKNIKKLITNLILQYITGKKFYLFLWFIQILLIYTIFFEIIFLLFGKNSLFIFQTIAIISYWSQYNLKIYNLIIYKNFVRMIPFAVTGLNLGSLELLNKLIKFKIKSIFFSILKLIFHLYVWHNFI